MTATSHHTAAQHTDFGDIQHDDGYYIWIRQNICQYLRMKSYSDWEQLMMIRLEFSFERFFNINIDNKYNTTTQTFMKFCSNEHTIEFTTQSTHIHIPMRETLNALNAKLETSTTNDIWNSIEWAAWNCTNIHEIEMSKNCIYAKHGDQQSYLHSYVRLIKTITNSTFDRKINARKKIMPMVFV